MALGDSMRRQHAATACGDSMRRQHAATACGDSIARGTATGARCCRRGAKGARVIAVCAASSNDTTAP